MTIILSEILKVQADDPPWLKQMLSVYGLHELPGPKAHEKILEMFTHTNLGKPPQGDETPWCSASMCWAVDTGLKAAKGKGGTNSAAARSWLTWGAALDLPKRGAIAIYSRDGGPGSGHVAIWLADEHGSDYLLGGNQLNAVSIRPYSKARRLGFRWAAPAKASKSK